MLYKLRRCHLVIDLAIHAPMKSKTKSGDPRLLNIGNRVREVMTSHIQINAIKANEFLWKDIDEQFRICKYYRFSLVAVP